MVYIQLLQIAGESCCRDTCPFHHLTPKKKKKKKKKKTTNNEITEFRMSYQFHSNVDVGVHYTTENISSISIQIDKYMRSKGKPTTVQKVKT